MCDCQSYNRPDWGGSTPEVVLPHPDYPRGVCVDACMVPLIRDLWGLGIRTFGCCCGHNGGATRYVMLARPGDVKLATELINERKYKSLHVIVWAGIEHTEQTK